MADGKVKFWKDGVEVPIEAVPDGTIDASTVASLDQDGTLHILITPEITGTKEAIDALSPILDETYKLGGSWQEAWAGIMPTTTMDMVDSALGRIQSYQETLDYNWWDKFWASVFGASTNLGVLDQSMKSDFNPEIVAEMSAYVAEVVSAIHQGVQVPEEDLNNLQTILDFLNGLDTTGTGAHIREGIAQGMTEAGFDSDAETVATNLETALNTALDMAERVRQLVDENARVQRDQDEFKKDYEALIAGHAKLSEKIQTIAEQKRNKVERRRRIEIFLHMLEEQKECIGFEPGMFVALVDKVIIQRDGHMEFCFRNGMKREYPK